MVSHRIPLLSRERLGPVLKPGLGQAQGLSKDKDEFTIPLNPPLVKGGRGDLPSWQRPNSKKGRPSAKMPTALRQGLLVKGICK